jgi:hypothetical protein
MRIEGNVGVRSGQSDQIDLLVSIEVAGIHRGRAGSDSVVE